MEQSPASPLPYKSNPRDHRRSYENTARILVVLIFISICSLYLWGEQIAQSEHIREAGLHDSATLLP